MFNWKKEINITDIHYLEVEEDNNYIQKMFDKIKVGKKLKKYYRIIKYFITIKKDNIYILIAYFFMRRGLTLKMSL